MANLVTTITESITLNGKERGSTNSLTIGSVTEIFHRIVTCPTGEDTTVATFQAATNTSDGALDLDNVKYVRVTNLDDTNPINLSLQVAGGEDGTANMSTTILVAAGRSFVMGSPHDGIALDDDAAGIVTSLVDLESLLVDPSSNNVTVEVFIAC
mgnify:CR=1 FL=1|tara:strand:- start:4824 stop:5288 length:465 start_codon:yes stop_codon:yes gene_type:complete